MLLACHLLTGAAIAAKIKSVPLVIFLAFLSHYFLDFLPHRDYSVENTKNRQWEKSLPELLKVFLDFGLGVFLIFIFSEKQPIIFIGAFFAVLADGLNFLNLIFPNKILTLHSNFHQKIHFLKSKKISPFWGVIGQVLVIFVTLFLLQNY